jgi:integrase/recombinase XerD
VRGKGRRDVRLPLPQDAGDAVLDYIEHARPQVAIDRVFLCAKAPFRPLRSGITVSDIVRAALRRSGALESRIRQPVVRISFGTVRQP